MNNIVNRRRVYDNKDGGIKIREGYTLGSYFNVDNDSYAALHETAAPYDCEILVEPSRVTGVQFIIGFNGYVNAQMSGSGIKMADSTTLSNVFSVGVSRLIYLEARTGGTSKLYVDGEDTGLSTTKGVQPYIAVFGATKFANQYRGKVFYIKIYKNGAVIHHYVPVIRDSDNVSRIYDAISDSFINLQTGTLKVVK